MKNNINRLADSALNEVVGGGAGPNRFVSSSSPSSPSPSPSIESLPCEYSFRADLIVCPRTEAEKLCYNCEGCRLNVLAKPLGR